MSPSDAPNSDLRRRLDSLQQLCSKLQKENERIRRRSEKYLKQRREAEQQRDEAENERDKWEKKYWKLKSRAVIPSNDRERTPSEPADVNTSRNDTSNSEPTHDVPVDQEDEEMNEVVDNDEPEEDIPPQPIKEENPTTSAAEVIRQQELLQREFEEYQRNQATRDTQMMPSRRDMNENEVPERLPSTLHEAFSARFNRYQVANLIPQATPKVLRRTFPHRFLSDAYGAKIHDNPFCWISPRTREAHGHSHQAILCLDISLAPWSPHFPGEVGLLFSLVELNWPERLPVIVKIGQDKLQYMGHYSVTPCDPLTPREIELQPQKVKEIWNSYIINNPRAIRIRNKMLFRKRFGRSPTTEELYNFQPDPSVDGNLIPEDVDNALTREDETVEVYCLRPMQYHKSFQEELLEKYQNWITIRRRERPPPVDTTWADYGMAPQDPSYSRPIKRRWD
ncbi:hypothetical protein FRB99_001060 [Tulasnella sp. 403]|nr:hypothetical protein FRB99_001060 [Tulasnella sp. 403]